MATLIELAQIKGTTGFTDLKNKITAAVAIKAASVEAEASPAQTRIDFAVDALKNPSRVAGDIIYGMIADSASSSVANIVGAADESIQTVVDKWFDFAAQRS